MDEKKADSEKWNITCLAILESMTPKKRALRQKIAHIAPELHRVISEYLQNTIENGMPDEPSTSGVNSSSLVDSDENSRTSFFEDCFSTRTQHLVRVASKKRLTINGGDGDTNEGGNSTGTNGQTKANGRIKREVKKMEQLRSRRLDVRRNRRSLQKRSFDCSESELPRIIAVFYLELLDDDKNEAIDCYSLLIESLSSFFKGKTWPANTANLLTEFVRSNLHKSCDQLADEYDRKPRPINENRRLVEYETQILIELFLVKADDSLLMDTSILRKFEFLQYMGTGGRVREFLNEIVSDLFSGSIGRQLAAIFDHFCLQLPVDLVEFAQDSQDSPWKIGDNRRKMMAKCRNLQIVDRLLTGQVQGARPGAHKGRDCTKRETVQAKIHSSIRRSLTFTNLHTDKSTSRNDQVAKNMVSITVPAIPDTPDDKLRQRCEKRCKTDIDNDDECARIVKQTPTEKMKRTKSIKLGARQSPRQHASTLEIAKRRILSPEEKKLRQIRRGTRHLEANKILRMNDSDRMNITTATVISRADFLPLEEPDLQRSPIHTNRQKSLGRLKARRNLLQRHFSDPNGLATNVGKDSVKMDQVTSWKASNVNNDKNKPDGKLALSLAIDDYEMSSTAVERYRRRVDKIRSAKYKSDGARPNMLFYGKDANRTNLFDEPQSVTSSVNTTMVTRSLVTRRIATASSRCNTRKTAKNRQGRTIVQSLAGGIYHTCHTLLDADNDRPTLTLAPKLVAQKAGKCAFKLTRLIRRPSRSQRRLLVKRRHQWTERAGSVRTEESDMSSSSRSTSLRPSLSFDDGDHLTRNDTTGKLLLSPRTNGLLKLATFLQCSDTKRSSHRRRSLSLSDFPFKIADTSRPLVESKFNKLSVQPAVASSSTSSLVDSEDTLSAEDVFQIVCDKTYSDSSGQEGRPENWSSTSSFGSIH